MQEGKCSSNNSLPELLQWDAEAEIFNLPEELLEEQSCESKLFFTCFPPFLNYSGSGALHLYYHLPLSVRLQKLKRKGDYLDYSPPPQSLGESHEEVNEAELVTQKVSALAW